MLQYKVGDDSHYGFSYKETKEQFHRFNDMSDEEFCRNITKALHFAVFVCFIKEIPGYVCLADDGIIHRLTHMLDLGGDSEGIENVRECFADTLRLI